MAARMRRFQCSLQKAVGHSVVRLLHSSIFVRNFVLCVCLGLAQRNLVPRQMNRTVIKSPSSPPATACDQVFPAQSLQATASNNSSDNNVAAAGDVTPGYASDESSTSSSLGGGGVSGAARQPSGGKRRPRVAASRGILQRTSYWERRVEQGLLSDSSVTEEFPPLHEGRANSAAKS